MKNILKQIIVIAFGIMLLTQAVQAEVYSSIAGRVIAEDTGKGVSGVGIIARSERGDEYTEFTDVNGLYAFKEVLPGKYVLGFGIENSNYYLAERYKMIEVSQGKNVVNANNLLKLGSSISGTVYGSDGTTPIAGAGIIARMTERTSRELLMLDINVSAITDSNGTFTLKGLPPASYTLEVDVAGYANQNKIVQVADIEPVMGIDFTFKDDNVTGISGYVRYSSDQSPIDNAMVQLYDSNWDDVGYSYTDENGRYSIVGILPGIYKATAHLPGGAGHISRDVLIEPGKIIDVDFEFDKTVSLPWNS